MGTKQTWHRKSNWKKYDDEMARLFPDKKANNLDRVLTDLKQLQKNVPKINYSDFWGEVELAIKKENISFEELVEYKKFDELCDRF